MKKKFLIITEDIEIKDLIILTINEKMIGTPFKEIVIKCFYDFFLKKQEDVYYDFVFFDIRHINCSIVDTFNKLQELFKESYFILIEDEKTQHPKEMKSTALGSIILKDNFNFESISTHIALLMEIAQKNKHYKLKTNKLLSICENIENIYSSIVFENHPIEIAK